MVVIEWKDCGRDDITYPQSFVTLIYQLTRGPKKPIMLSLSQNHGGTTKPVRNYPLDARSIMAHDIDALLAYRDQAPHAARAHPSEEHLLPLFVALGAAGDNYVAKRVFAGFEGGALAMDAYRFN